MRSWIHPTLYLCLLFPYSVGVSWRLCSCGVGLVQSVDVVMESLQCNLGPVVCVSLPLPNITQKVDQHALPLGSCTVN